MSSYSLNDSQPITRVMVAGTGVLGAQIAFQCAFSGVDVIAYDVDTGCLDRANARFDELGHIYAAQIGATREQIEAARARIVGNIDLGSAAIHADLVIEAIPEDLAIKQSFYRTLSALAPADTIFATNSSTLVPSQLVSFTDQPERLLTLHFAHDVWKHNIAEIMGHPGTDPVVFKRVVQFASRIGMVPLPLRKEQPGYLLNAMLIPMLLAALGLLVNDVADMQTIDKAWMIAKGDRIGPFGILDGIGMTTVYNVTRALAERTGDSTHQRIADYVKTHFIETGYLGESTGRGFYRYPDPDFLDPAFVAA
ncbi:3-hydroxyacyl-CoA dehydrogenase [Paraburkholderia silviterrae]|uniref:3-hydroxyacyl-CoA dehydrogenase n=1 Tax=Paraburkholderia silviterrae TaxID=2528715 RepID=A0A4R5LXS8_9BURK|nr:3-hydroxyacyl-CoA dehydrogenase [Paraburkholderia silviterrae]TDG16592.1 3-hydroxyacyl-CoA dehydrogenase [Paraburkholderia silviterrae]